MPHPYPPFAPDLRRLGVGMYQHSDPPMTLQEVADYLTPLAPRPISRRTVYGWVVKAGVTLRRSGGGRSRHKPKIPAQEMEKRACWLYRELGKKASIREVGRLLGVSHTWVRTTLEKHGVPRRPQQISRGHPPEAKDAVHNLYREGPGRSSSQVASLLRERYGFEVAPNTIRKWRGRWRRDG